MRLILNLFKNLLLFFLKILFSIQNSLRIFFVNVKYGLMLEKRVSIYSLSHLKVGRNVYISEGSILQCGGEKWCGYKGGISIGDGSHIGCNCVLLGGGQIEIGNKCGIGPGTVITSQGHYYNEINKYIFDQDILLAKIIIEDDVFIGANCTVLSGVTIGKGSFIGAGAVVTKNITPYSIAVGVPAKVIKKRGE